MRNAETELVIDCKVLKLAFRASGDPVCHDGCRRIAVHVTDLMLLEKLAVKSVGLSIKMLIGAFRKIRQLPHNQTVTQIIEIHT